MNAVYLVLALFASKLTCCQMGEHDLDPEIDLTIYDQVECTNVFAHTQVCEDMLIMSAVFMRDKNIISKHLLSYAGLRELVAICSQALEAPAVRQVQC